MYNIKEYKLNEISKQDTNYLYNWPMLYILTNKKNTGYVGQTTSVVTRMKQHSNNSAKKTFTDVTTIYSDIFNQSVTFDYESKLIQFMVADGKYKLTNSNSGLADKNYFGKELYDKNFDILWNDLIVNNLAINDLLTIKNSEIFRYSPFKTLTEAQMLIVNQIVEKISNPNNILFEGTQKSLFKISGEPGSGKTIIGSYLTKYFKDSLKFKNMKIAFVIPQTSLRKTMKQIFKNIEQLRSADVIGPSQAASYEGKYDILIVDEAHKLKRRTSLVSYGSFDKTCQILGLDPQKSTQLDWLLVKAKNLILFYDEFQSIGPSEIKKDEFTKNILKSNFKIYNHNLIGQMRIVSEKAYVLYIHKIFKQEVAEKTIFSTYQFKLYNHFTDFYNDYLNNSSSNDLVRMISGFGFEWKSKNDKESFDFNIEGIQMKWNSTIENWINSENSQNEVGCIHTIQGYDLNYAFVIISNEIFLNDEGNIDCDKNKYFDRHGKEKLTNEQLLNYIKNIYYVLLTRGIKGTYIYVCDVKLREYLKQYIDVM